MCVCVHGPFTIRVSTRLCVCTCVCACARTCVCVCSRHLFIFREVRLSGLGKGDREKGLLAVGHDSFSVSQKFQVGKMVKVNFGPKVGCIKDVQY